MIPIQAARLLLLAALAVLAPQAQAGTRDDPDVTDPADVDRTSADLLAAWFAATKDGLRFSIQTTDGSRPDEFPDHLYWVGFRLAGRPVTAFVGFADDGLLRGHLGEAEGPLWARGGFEEVANDRVVDLRGDRGRPSTWSGTIPWGAVDGLEPGVTLVDLRAGTSWYDRDANAWERDIDVAASPRVFVAKPPAPLLPIRVPGVVLPILVAAATAAGAVAGLIAYRVHKARRVAPPPAQPGREGPPPPGSRFRHDPRR